MIKEKINSVYGKSLNAIFALQRKALFTTLTDLRFTMRRYIALVVDQDLSKIKRYNLPISNKLILSVYAELMEEYGALSDNKEVNAARERRTTFEALVRKQNILVSALMVLQVMPEDKDTIAFLNRSGIRGENIIDRVENEIKIINLRISEQEKLIKPKDGKGHKKAELADYLAMFIRMNEENIKSDIDMPVLEYIKARQRYDQKQEAARKQMEQIKNRK